MGIVWLIIAGLIVGGLGRLVNPGRDPMGWLATVAVGITTEEGNENVTTTPLDGMKFSAGDVPLGEPISLRVELRDNTNRLVAFGRVEQTIKPDRSDQKITIPVRKPIIYISSEKSVVTIDPTFDGFDPKFQGMIAGTTGAIAFPIVVPRPVVKTTTVAPAATIPGVDF